MRKIWLVLTLFLLNYAVCEAQTSQQQSSIDAVTVKLIAGALQKKLDLSQVNKYAAAINADGSWNDIDYSDTAQTKWTPLSHLERLKDMAIALKKGGQPEDQSLKKKIILGIEFYLRRQPKSSNWWYRDIGAPQQYMVTLILLKGAIDKSWMAEYAAFLKDLTPNPSHRGKNRSWVSEITIYKGCAEDNFTLVESGFKSMASTLKVEQKQGAEGIKIDDSFHQHHEQLYSGGYGLSLMDDYADYIELSAGTLFKDSFTPAQRKLFTEVLLNGHQLFGYRYSFDFGALGRNISRKGNGGNVSAELLKKVILLDPEHRADYTAWINHLEGGAFPKNYIGNKHFFKSDIMTQHGYNYYLSAKIISKRTLGTEALNGENLKGFNLPMGATNIKTSGNEYKDIAPVWDWSRIPGTTAEQNDEATKLEGYIYGSNTFGGGASNGTAGALAFDYDYKGLKAKKAYFFLGDAMVCLGAGITARKDSSIATSVNQTLLNGVVTTNFGQFNPGKTSYADLKWVYHDGVGYIFPNASQTVVKAMDQTGSWRSINKAEDGTVLSRKVFSVWLDHGNKPSDESYAYIVVPRTTLVNFKDYISKQDLKIIRNDTTIQAVSSVSRATTEIIFHQAGKVDIGAGVEISVDGAAIVIVAKLPDNSWEIAAADPFYKASSVRIRVNQKMEGHGSSWSEGASTLIHFDYPTGDLTGKTVSGIFKIIK